MLRTRAIPGLNFTQTLDTVDSSLGTRQGALNSIITIAVDCRDALRAITTTTAVIITAMMLPGAWSASVAGSTFPDVANAVRIAHEVQGSALVTITIINGATIGRGTKAVWPSRRRSRYDKSMAWRFKVARSITSSAAAWVAPNTTIGAASASQASRQRWAQTHH